MEILSKSCVCQSTYKTFQIVANQNVTDLPFLCVNESKLAINLETQDYEALGFCQPPVMDQYYSVGLRLPNDNSTNSQKCNSSHPYFWSARKTVENIIDCVDSLPLELPGNFDEDERCNLASVLPGSSDQIYNATWTRCNSVQYSICQLEKTASNSNFCENVSTTTALPNNSTAIIIGSVLGVFAVFLFLCLLHLFRKRNNAQRNGSDNEARENVYNK